MDDTTTPPLASPSGPIKPRRRGLIAPLPAVVVGLGLVSGPAAAQAFLARPDTFVLPFGTTTTFLPVVVNDTLPNAAMFVVPTKPFPVGNVIAQLNGLFYTPPPGFVGMTTAGYCIQGLAPPNACALVTLIVEPPEVPVPALSGAALVGLSGVLGWLGMRLRRRG